MSGSTLWLSAEFASEKKRSATGPFNWPILGVLPQLKRDPPGFLLECARKYGPVVPMRIGAERVFLAAHPDAVDHVTRRNATNYVKTKFAEKLKPLLGNGIATSNGATWRASRRVIQPSLKPDEIARLVGDIDKVITASVDRWVASGGTLDMSAESCALTLRVIAKTMFGEESEENVATVVKAVGEVQERFAERIWSAFPIFERLPTAKNRAFQQALDDVFGVVLATIRRRRAAPRGNDLLAAMLDAVDESGAPFTDQQILDDVMTIFMAGHETTGNTLAWLWETLANRPDVQDRLRSELLTRIPLDRSPTIEQLRRLPYTNAVLQETMRLKPSAWWFIRTAVADDEVMGHRIRAGDSVIISQYVTHRLEEFWPDPGSFRPERFLDGKTRHPFAHIPFGAGPRKCPGSHFALIEMSLGLARALSRLEFHPVKGAQPRPYEALVTLRPKDGMPVRVKPYRGNVFIQGCKPGEHALLDAAMRLRRRVFVEKLGWPLQVDEAGREIDQFDTEHAGYFVLLDKGQVAACARVLPTEKPSLLYDVFPHLIANPKQFAPAPTVWEGARMAVNPDLSTSKCRYWCSRLLHTAICQAQRSGIARIYTVSDPVMERVLRRIGANPTRLGPVVRDRHGHLALALMIECTPETAAAILGGGERNGTVEVEQRRAA